jgi:peptide/nickel transport system permease protein
VAPVTAIPTTASPTSLSPAPRAPRRRQSGTWHYAIGRVGQSLLTLFGVLTIVFFAERLSGSPVRLLAGPDATPADITNLTKHLGLNRPISDQYLRFLGDAIRGNLGYSYVQNQPALHIVFSRIPYTAELAVAALLFSLVLGIPIGILSAFYRGRWPERVLMPIVLVGQSMPAFWSGILLILVFSVHFHFFPSSGTGGLKALVLPMVTLGSLSLSTVARMARSSFIENLGKDYVRTAAAKGASTLRVLLGHVFRNALLPILTITGLEAGNLLGGAVITETIFAWPGIGQLTVQSVESLDFPVVEAVVLVTATIYIAVNLLVDLLYGVVDPRLRVRGPAA